VKITEIFGFGKSQDDKNFDQLVKISTDRWNQLVKLNPSLKDDHEALQNYVANHFKNGTEGKGVVLNPEEVDLPPNMTPAGVQAYIKKYAGIWKTRDLGYSGAPNAGGATQTPQGGQQGVVAQGNAAHGAKDVEKHDMAPGVQIVSQEPIIIKYQNKDYGLNDNGQWSHLATGKVPHESFQEFLSKQHDQSIPQSPTKSVPQAQPQTAPQPQTAEPPAVWKNNRNPAAPATTQPTPAPVAQPQAKQGGRAARSAMMKRIKANTAKAKAPATPGSTNEGIDLADILWRKMKLQEAREQLTESQNVFKDAEGNQVARRIMTTEIPSTISWLEKITGLDFTQEKDKEGYPTKWLGTTGRKKGTEKEPGSSGDLDLSVDDKSITKEELKAILIKWCLQQGIPQEQIENRKDFRDGWVAMSGDSVHFKTPINGDVKNGFAQTDFMFGDPKWQAFAMKGGRENSPYKGMARHIILASIVSAINPNYTWSYKNGIIDKSVNPKKPTTIEGGKDPRTLSKLTGIPISKLNTADDIIEAISKRPDYEQLVAKARETLAHDNIQLPETAPIHTAAWMKTL